MVPNNIPDNEFNRMLINKYEEVIASGIKWSNIIWDRFKKEFIVS